MAKASATLNINIWAGLSRKWVGVKEVVYVCFSGPVDYGEEEKHTNKIARKSRGKILLMCSVSGTAQTQPQA